MTFDERTLNGMSVLAAVACSGSFASAAEALNMSPPGISRAIARTQLQIVFLRFTHRCDDQHIHVFHALLLTGSLHSS
jgi:hypothetical protein